MCVLGVLGYAAPETATFLHSLPAEDQSDIEFPPVISIFHSCVEEKHQDLEPMKAPIVYNQVCPMLWHTANGAARCTISYPQSSQYQGYLPIYTLPTWLGAHLFAYSQTQ